MARVQRLALRVEPGTYKKRKVKFRFLPLQIRKLEGNPRGQEGKSMRFYAQRYSNLGIKPYPRALFPRACDLDVNYKQFVRLGVRIFDRTTAQPHP